MNHKDITAEKERAPWFAAARCLLCDEGVPTAASYTLARRLRRRKSLLKEVSFAKDATLSVIDSFLDGGEHRIVESEQTPDEVTLSPTAAEEAESDFVSEDLAQIYTSQGLFDAAEEIYRKLSLAEPKKSIYFAELIAKLEAQRLDNSLRATEQE